MSKKILFVCYGDSTSPKAWSNVPFLFSENLEKQGFEIIRVNIAPNENYESLWNRYAGKILSRLFHKQEYSFIKTPIHRYLAYQKIKKAVRNNPDLYFAVILSFDFYNKFSNTPTLLLHDWTYDMIILDRQKRKPYFFEKWFINYQHTAFNKSEIVVSLFKDAQRLISERHGKKVHHLGSNVVNDINFSKTDPQEIIFRKRKSKQLLMIGSAKYLKGARKLVQAQRILQKDFPGLTVTFINLPKDRLLLEESDRNIICHDYLDKGDSAQNKKYYDLLVNTKILVNPAEVWAAYSSTIECMYYYTPIIIKPYDAFVLDYGRENDFGVFLEDTDVPTIVNAIRKVMTMEISEYEKLCMRAHELVKDQTWENYTKKIVALMEDAANNKSIK